MVVLSRIYTRTGDEGQTALGDGSRVGKQTLRVQAYGTVDETNATVGMARLHATAEMDAALMRISNDLFDLGADLCRPGMERDAEADYPPLRVIAGHQAVDADDMRLGLAPGVDQQQVVGGVVELVALQPGRVVDQRAVAAQLLDEDPIAQPRRRAPVGVGAGEADLEGNGHGLGSGRTRCKRGGQRMDMAAGHARLGPARNQ